MAMLDAVAELFELAQRGEDCLAEDGDRVMVMVENSRTMLWGIAASFAAVDLQAAVVQATASTRRPPETRNVREMGGASGWTYAQPTRSGAPPLGTRTRAPPR